MDRNVDEEIPLHTTLNDASIENPSATDVSSGTEDVQRARTCAEQTDSLTNNVDSDVDEEMPLDTNRSSSATDVSSGTKDVQRARTCAEQTDSLKPHNMDWDGDVEMTPDTKLKDASTENPSATDVSSGTEDVQRARTCAEQTDSLKTNNVDWDGDEEIPLHTTLNDASIENPSATDVSRGTKNVQRTRIWDDPKQWIPEFDACCNSNLGRALCGHVLSLLEVCEVVAGDSKEFVHEAALIKQNSSDANNSKFLTLLHDGYQRRLKSGKVKPHKLALVLKAAEITFPKKDARYAKQWLKLEPLLNGEKWKSFATLCGSLAFNLENTIETELKGRLLRESKEHGLIDIELVLIAHGGVSWPLPDLDSVINPALIKKTIPAFSLFCNENLSSVTLYQPCGADIDFSAVAAIVTDTIHPSNVVFTPEIQTQFIPEHFYTIPNDNTIRDDSEVNIPDVWYSRLSEEELLETKLRLKKLTGVKRLVHFLSCEEPVPLFLVTRLIGLVTAVISLVHDCDLRVNLHYSSCLSGEKPPQGMLQLKRPSMSSTANLSES